MGDNSLYHVLALISKNHKYNKMKSSFIYLLFLYIILFFGGVVRKKRQGIWEKQNCISTNVFLLYQPMVILLSG